MNRVPIAPLANAMGLTEHQACQQLGLTGSTYQDYRRRGLTEHVAERLATTIGLHPWTIWPELADHHVANATRHCPECDTPFIPTNRRHTYCTRRCGNRARNRIAYRQRYRTDPTFAEAERARRRATYAECADYEKARQARYRQQREAA